MDKRAFLKEIEIAGQKYSVYDLNIFEERGLAAIRRFPFCLGFCSRTSCASSTGRS